MRILKNNYTLKELEIIAIPQVALAKSGCLA